MIKLKNWIGLSALLLSLQVYAASEINIQDAWIRPLTPGQEEAIVGMVINSTRQARIIGAISPAYTAVTLQGPSKSGAIKTQEIGFIDLPAQKSVVLVAESVHLRLTGNRQTLSAADKVQVFVTIQFEDKTSKTINVMAQAVGSNLATPASTVEAKTVTPPPQPAPSKVMPSPVEVAKPVVAPKPPVAEVKPVKAAPVAAPKPAPAPVAARVDAAPLPAPVAPPVAVVAPLAVELKKAPEVKPAEQPKQEEARASAECISLAEEIRSCDRSNDTMLAWCETNAKSKYTCPLTMEQLKKLRRN